MRDILKKRIFGTRLDRADGALGAKRLAILVALLLIVGGGALYLAQRHIASIDTWRATVTAVAPKGTCTFTFEERGGETEFASYPAGMRLREGDRVLIRIDEDKGNLVIRVLDD